jgi:3beta-hydroxy-Delta5-steroid dehydrogenase / steroid Delta-isomerase
MDESMPIPNAIPPPPELTPTMVGTTCLVTGGAGYLGSSLIQRLLAIGCKVRSLDLRKDLPAKLANSGVEHHAVDLRHYQAMEPAFQGVDTVFHTAALISLVAIDRAQPALRRRVFGVNVVGTENVIRAAQANHVGRLIHTSSINVVMDHPIENGDESLPYATNTTDLYSVTKIAAEKRILAANSRQQDGLKTCALRPGGIWGAGQGSVMIDTFVRELAKGAFQATIGNGRSSLDNTHIENVIDAQLLAANELRANPDKIGGQVYFITDNERFDAMEWYRPLVEGLGHTFPKLKLPGKLMVPVAGLLEWAHRCGAAEPIFSRRSIRNITEGCHFSIAKAQADLGYNPRYQRSHLVEMLPELQAYYNEVRRSLSR